MAQNQPYVMFGYNQLLMDFAEIIHLNGGHLSTIVCNVSEPKIKGRRSLAERLSFLARAQAGAAPAIITLDDFQPKSEELYLMGFPGQQMEPLVQHLTDSFELGFCTLVHPKAVISPSADVAPGCIINAGAIIASGARLEKHVFVNRGAIIGHDTRIDSFGIVQPGAKLAGYIRMERGATIGIGACVIEDRKIGAGSVVAAGAVVTRDVPPGVMVAGVPAVQKKLLSQH